MTTRVADVSEWLEERQQRFITIADTIWATPEVALAETKACKLQADELAQDGFRITRNIGDLPTAFMAEWGSGAPIIGFLGEYDALPGLSQKIPGIAGPDRAGRRRTWLRPQPARHGGAGRRDDDQIVVAAYRAARHRSLLRLPG